MKDAKVIGVILAAGKGTRIYPFSETLPKPILPVGNRPLLEYQIDIMKSCGISEVIIVIGHLGYAIVDALGDGSRQGVKIKYVEQKESLGMAHALCRLESYINCPFALFLGDIYFVANGLCHVIDEVVSGDVHANLISIVENDPEMIKRNYAILESGPGIVSRVIEKPKYAPSKIKGCGLYIFSQHIFDAIRRTPRTAMRNEYEITESIQIMINDGFKVCHRSAINYDLNLTVPEDLLRVNLTDLSEKNVPNLIGGNVDIHEGARVKNSIISDGVKVRHPILIEDSMIFPDVDVEATSDLRKVILYEDRTIHCNTSNLL